MTTLLNILCAFVFGASSLTLLLFFINAGKQTETEKLSACFVGGWIAGALAMLSLMRFL